MKKVATIAAIIAAGASSLALAEGFKGELGYQVNQTANNYGACFNECFGESDDRGFAVGLSYDVNDNITVGVDYSTTEDDNSLYGGDSNTTEATRTAVEVAYSFDLGDSSSSFVALNYAMTEWSFEAEYGIWGPTDYVYESDVSGVSGKVGATKNLTDDTSITAGLSMGFETGVEVAVETALTEKLGLKASLSNLSYESDDWTFERGDGSTMDSDSEDDMQIDTQALRVSATYAF